MVNSNTLQDVCVFSPDTALKMHYLQFEYFFLF